MSDSALKTLAASVVVQGENAQYVAGKMLVLEMALLALVRSHPNPAAFAAEFRRAWQLAGSHHSNDAHAPQTQDGIGEMLTLLEEACPGLAVRPPK